MYKNNNPNSPQIEHNESVGDSQIPYIGMGNPESELDSKDLELAELRLNLPEFYTLQELEKIEFNIDPVVEGLLYRGNISIVGAKPKVGKSTLMRFAAKCIVDGDQFLGRKTFPCKVLYLALEEPLANVKRDFQAMGVTNKNDLLIASLYDEPNRLQAMEKLIEQLQPGLVVVDTMVHISRITDLNDYIQTTASLKKIRDIAEKYNCHILLVHHSRKGESSGNDSTILGSTGLIGAVDLIIQLETDENKIRLLSTNGRSGDHFEKIALEFNQETMCFSVASKYTPISEIKIIEAINANPGVTRDELQRALKIRSEDLTKSLLILEVDGLIETKKANRKNTYYPKFINSSIGEGE